MRGFVNVGRPDIIRYDTKLRQQLSTAWTARTEYQSQII
jgi:hypothetical protein